jgi:hypothetical protein
MNPLMHEKRAHHPSPTTVGTLAALLISSVVLLLIAEALLLTHVFTGERTTPPASAPTLKVSNGRIPGAHPTEDVVVRSNGRADGI